MHGDTNTVIALRVADFHVGRLNCAETVLYAFSEIAGIDMTGFAPMIATPFGGGMCGHQLTCGALTGALMVIGLKKGRQLGGDKGPAYECGREFIGWFADKYSQHTCLAITGIDMNDLSQNQAFRAPGGAHETICEPMVADVVRELVSRLI